MADLPNIAALVPAEQKARLRREALARRDLFAADLKRVQAAAASVSDRVISDYPAMLRGGIVAGYWPIRSELDPRPLMAALDERAVPLALPVITPDGLVFRRWRPGLPLIDAGFGTQGPPPEAPEVDPDVLLVPLSAFDRRGNRLGYGQGNYDKAISRLSAKRPLITIGVAFDVQEIGEIPAEPHDRPLDAIVTQVQSITITK
ncbi:5-formyltetrahydrofolate cyclo-ligase [Pseudochelatococcus lubricantis]|uniref:5-formyltetrahydrofolate cyclo-ligase n=1 Tax=Pseudochelatococcus lubricantis TaxID=1538102 RepID=A0ABX0V5K7_9HYPH|nr:5-formyltetrahydrofolate cyclo-ligase [Pseudochelatococcus lubricantis]NIJ58401.1 5-formyltetrahydrofolate cyclo-ligase [Pseudochelatococcus lubricantis]